MALFSSKEAEGMADKQGRSTAPRDGTLSIIAADLKVIGELQTDGVVKIDGIVEGNIKAERQVLVSKGGEVKGDVHSKEVIVGGKVCGGVYANGRVEVQSTASVQGDIATKRLLVHEGGEVNGNLRMTDPQAPDHALHSMKQGDGARQENRKAKPVAG